MDRTAQKQTENICLEAVKHDGFTLKYIQKKTKDICSEAMKQNSNSIQYINIVQFPEVWDKYMLENV